MASASTPSANEQAKDLVLVHTVHLKPNIKAQISGRMICGGISDVAITLVNSEKTHPKKLIIIIIIREYGSTLYVGLARAVSPTNTNFRLSFLLT